MTLSPKMLALVQKLEAADEKHFAGLRASARQEAEAAGMKRATSRQATAARGRRDGRPLHASARREGAR